LDPERQCSVGNQWELTTLPLGLPVWVCKGPFQIAMLCHTVKGLTSSDLGSRPSCNKQKERQKQYAEGSATVWPDLQHAASCNASMKCWNHHVSRNALLCAVQKASFQHWSLLVRDSACWASHGQLRCNSMLTLHNQVSGCMYMCMTVRLAVRSRDNSSHFMG